MATPNFFQQAKQAMELRSQMKKIQKQLESQTTDYENAGVKVTARGDMTIAAIKISPEVVDITRLDKLERQGWIARQPSPCDRRSLLVALTDEGRAVIDKAVAAHVHNEWRLLDPLSEAEQRQLADLLRRWLRAYE